MNRALALLSIFVFALAASAGDAYGQDEVTADVVAARVQQFYASTTTVRATFRQYFWHRVYQRTDSSGGRVSIDREGHRVRFDYDQPANQVIVSDGSEWTYYQPDPEGGAGQYFRGSAAEGSTGGLGFLMGTASIEDDFRRSLRAPSPTQPAHTDALVLRPRRPDPHYRSIVVYVDNRPASAGVVRRVSIETPDGDWNRFDFIDPEFNRTFDASTFHYTPPAGARDASASAPHAQR